MKKEKKEPKKSNQERIDACDYLASAASAMDCTGLSLPPPLPGRSWRPMRSCIPFSRRWKNRKKRIPNTFPPPPHMIIKNRSF